MVHVKVKKFGLSYLLVKALDPLAAAHMVEVTGSEYNKSWLCHTDVITGRLSGAQLAAFDGYRFVEIEIPNALFEKICKIKLPKTQA